MKIIKFLLLIILIVLAICSCDYLKSLVPPKDEPPFFHDMTIELGEEITLSPSLFTTENARNPEKITVQTDFDEIDTKKVGKHNISFMYGEYEETVEFSVRDTTPPKVEFCDFLTNPGYIPNSDDFIKNVEDFSRYDVVMTLPEDSYDMEIALSVIDCEGNKTDGTVHLTIDWMVEKLTLEYGDEISELQFLLSPDDDGKIGEEKINEINSSPVGEYVVEAESHGRKNSTVVSVVDTTPPALELEAVSVAPGVKVSAEDFVFSVFDLNMDGLTLKIETEIDYELVNEPQTVVVSATDAFGNRTEEETTFVVTLYIDKLPPVFKGLGEMTVVRGQTPNWNKGVSAIDDSDGNVHFKVDTSKVDINTIGTYYATYTAVDSYGNIATKNRRITVIHNDEDTANLVKSVADSLGSFETKREEALACRAYVMSIKYIYNNGGDDAVWYGFTYNKGECYVHAVCLKALLDARGFETYLCRTREKYTTPHFWVIVKIDGIWWHIDGTPVGYHPKYELMNDKQRLETVVNYGTKTYRDWDFDAYPKCNG